jgi:hypothetical protein
VAKSSPRSATNAKSNRGGRRKGSGAPPSTIKGVLATLPERYKAAFLRSTQNATEVMIKSILRGEKVTHVKTKTPTAVTPVEALERSPNEVYEICSPRSGRGGSRRGSGRKPFTLEGICSRYPQRAQRLRRDVMRLALEEVSRRFGVRTQQLRVKRKLASQRDAKRVPGPGKKLGRPRGTYNPSNVPAYLRTLRTELGIRELSDMRVALPMAELNKLLSTSGLTTNCSQRKASGAPPKWSAAQMNNAIALYESVGSWSLVAKKLNPAEWEKDQKGVTDRLRLAVTYYRENRRRREN